MDLKRSPAPDHMNNLNKAWNLPSEPWTFVINESGVIISKFEGFATKEEIEESIKTILN